MEATKALVTARVVMLVGDLKRTYFGYQAGKQLVEMLEQVVQATEASYLVAGRMREAGGLRQLDVLQERALYEQSKVAESPATTTAPSGWTGPCDWTTSIASASAAQQR